MTRYGRNTAATVKHLPLWLQFLSHFRNPPIIILLVVSGLLLVVTIVTPSISLDFVQEVRAQNAVEALRRSVAVQAIVLLACL